MDNTVEFSTLQSAIVEDFKKTSGYQFTFEPAKSDDFVLQIDPGLLINIIITPIVNQIVEYLGKFISERKGAEEIKLSDEEVQKVKELVVDFNFNSGMSPNHLVSREMTGKMAESVERVLREHPEVLLQIKNHKK